MNEEERAHLTTLLTRYYEADEPTAQRLAAEFMDRIDGFIKRCLQWEHLYTDEREELHQRSRIAIFTYLAAGRNGGRRIENPGGTVRQIVEHLVADKQRANTPLRQIELKLYAIIREPRFKDRVATWKIPPATYVGLKAWEGQPFRRTRRYQEFRQDDTAFVRNCLDGRHPGAPGQVKLWELLLKLFEWIETPLEWSTLVDHMLEFQPISTTRTESLEDLIESDAPAMPTDNPRLDREAYWQAIRDTTSFGRDVLLLNLHRNELIFLSGQPLPTELLAEILDISLPDMRCLWEQLPLPDAVIADRLKTTPGNVQRMRNYYKKNLAKKAGFSLP